MYVMQEKRSRKVNVQVLTPHLEATTDCQIAGGVRHHEIGARDAVAGTDRLHPARVLTAPAGPKSRRDPLRLPLRHSAPGAL